MITFAAGFPQSCGRSLRKSGEHTRPSGRNSRKDAPMACAALVAQSAIFRLLSKTLISAEGKTEFVGKLRPELAHYIPRHAIANAQAHAAGSGTEPARITRMIQVSKSFGTGSAEPLRVVEHGTP